MSQPLGYEADIYRATWERPTTWGAPKLWSLAWVVFCLYLGFLLFMTLGALWASGAVAGWFVGQGLLAALTLWDPQWDELLLDTIKGWLRGTRAPVYDAG